MLHRHAAFPITHKVTVLADRIELSLSESKSDVLTATLSQKIKQAEPTRALYSISGAVIPLRKPTQQPMRYD